MNSRQRVITAINHRQPDKVPVDLGATPSSGISTIAHHNLKKHLNINNKLVRVYDVVQQLAEPEWEIINHFNIDILDIGRAFNTNSNQWKNVKLPGNIPVLFPGWFKHRIDKDGVWYASNQNGQEIAKMPPGATFFDQTQFPYFDKYPDNFKDLTKAMELVMWSAFTVQTNTRDMDPATLKKEFGRDITFWGGGVDTATILNNGTTEEVRKQVLKRLEIFSKGGGYIFNTIHNILPDVAPENIIAMFKAIEEFNS